MHGVEAPGPTLGTYIYSSLQGPILARVPEGPGLRRAAPTQGGKIRDKSNKIGASQAQVKTKSSKIRDKSSKIGASQAQVKTTSSKIKDKSSKIGQVKHKSKPSQAKLGTSQAK